MGLPLIPNYKGATVSMYEESVLKINLLKKTEIMEYPFNWRPNIIGKILGDFGRNWQEINHYELQLESYHPTIGKYVPYTSKPFRAFQGKVVKDELVFPIPVKNMLLYQPKGQEWLKLFFLERKRCWEELNNHLIQNGWTGVTDFAIRRSIPFKAEYDSTMKESDLFIDGSLVIGKFESIERLMENYRYRRQVI